MKSFILLAFLVTSVTVFAQEPFRVMFYNVENLFDCRHDSLKSDYEFLPASVRGWHLGRYKKKINHIGKVIAAVGEWNPPALIGLCEVENEKVMDDLVKYSPLKEYEYRYVMTDSPDERGIDVALLWQRGSFKLLSYHSIRLSFKEKDRRPTRDILHVTGLVSSGDSLDVFVCHMPSRYGGEKESEPARLYAVSILKSTVDSICFVRTNPNILIMGDFNDYPENASIANILGAKSPVNPIDPDLLYNLMADKGDKLGTYNYQGEWGILDQLIVLGSLLMSGNKIHTSNEKAHICDFPFLLEDDSKYGGRKPFRTYYGMKYIGGFSDHLPVMVDFEISE